MPTRTIRRMKRNWKKAGFDGLYDHRHHRPSPKRVPVQELEKVLGLYRDRYSDFNVRHFHEKLREVHAIELSYTWVKTALQTAGLVSKRRKRGPHRQERALVMELLHRCSGLKQRMISVEPKGFFASKNGRNDSNI